MTTTDFSHLDDPAEREWLTNVPAADVLANAHRIYDFMHEAGIPADSYTRELAFTKAAAELGIDYDVLYDAWLAPALKANGYGSPDDLEDELRAINGVPDDAHCKMVESETSHEEIDEDDDEPDHPLGGDGEDD